MKYTSVIKIEKHDTEVIEKFSDPDNMKHWQQGFISMEHIIGNLGEESSKIS